MTTAAGLPYARMSLRRGVLIALVAAAFLGFAISLYLTLMHYRGFVVPCHIVKGCETVQTSRFSTILGIPLSLMGTLYFTTMFYLAIGLLTGFGSAFLRLYKVLAYAGALAVIPLFLIQAVLLRAFCSYCLATEALMLLLWGLSFAVHSPTLDVGTQAEPGQSEPRRKAAQDQSVTRSSMRRTASSRRSSGRVRLRRT